MIQPGRTLILDLQSGISGDMFVAAAAQLAGCEADVLSLPALLGLPHVRCEFRAVVRGGIRCRKFDVWEGGLLAENASAAPARMIERSPAAVASAEASALPGAEIMHARVDGDALCFDTSQLPAHHHRPLSEIKSILNRAVLEPAVRDRALRMFERLGQVEADAHGIPVEQVQFHEVGAIDSIIDIVAAALCIERLNAEAVYASPICVGHGTVRTAHGLLPVPAPATERLLQGMPIFNGELSGEWTTPTGALILAELKPQFGDAVQTVIGSACGAGGKDTPKRPNFLRLRLAQVEASQRTADAFVRDELVVLYSNIDDSTGELLGADLIDLLLRSGARDALLHPVLMKKGRPGQQLEVLVESAQAETLASLILTHTSTIGVRLIPARRLTLPRESTVVGTRFGQIAAKRVRLPDGTHRTLPEYEACRVAADRCGVPIQTVYRAASSATEVEPSA